MLDETRRTAFPLRAVRRYLEARPLSRGDLEAALAPVARVELDKSKPANCWTVLLPVWRDAPGAPQDLERVANEAFDILVGLGIWMGDRRLVVAKRDASVGVGCVRVKAELLPDADVPLRCEAAFERGWGVVLGTCRAYAPLVLEVDWSDLPVTVADHATVGRVPGSGRIWCPSDVVGRDHGEFFHCEGSWFFRDFDSTNGSRVDGRPVRDASMPLTVGSTVLLAESARIIVREM